MKYTSIIFDCYGTLFLFGDMKKAWKDWFNSLFNFLVDAGVNIDYEYLNSEIDHFFSIQIPLERENNFTVFEQRLFTKLSSIGINLSPAKISELAQTTINAWHEEVTIDPDAIEVLNKLKNNFRLALLSNFDHPCHIYSMFNKYKLTDYFEKIIISGEVGVEKPDPEIFSITLDQLNLKKEEVVYVGDSEEDYLGSKNTGIDFLLINRNHESTTKLSNDYREDTTELENDWTKKYDNIKRITSLTELLDL